MSTVTTGWLQQPQVMQVGRQSFESSLAASVMAHGSVTTSAEAPETLADSRNANRMSRKRGTRCQCTSAFAGRPPGLHLAAFPTTVRIHAKYYGWRYALYLSGLLHACMVAAGVTVNNLFAALGQIPERRPSLEEMVGFEIDHTFYLNLVFL